MRTRRERKENASYKKARKRLSKFETKILFDWIDQHGTDLARAVWEYRCGRLPLDNVMAAMVGLEAALDILRERDDSGLRPDPTEVDHLVSRYSGVTAHTTLPPIVGARLGSV